MTTSPASPSLNLDPTFVEFQFLLLLQAHMLNSLMDGAFLYKIITKLRRRMKKENGNGIVFRPLKSGVANTVGEQVVNSWFESVIDEAYFEGRGYYDVFNLLPVLRSVWFTVAFKSRKVDAFEKKIWPLLRHADTLGPDAWCKLAIEEGAPLLYELVKECRKSSEYREIRTSYGMALADRILHDRQLCFHLAEHLVRLAPMKSNGQRRRLAARVRLPNYISGIVVARDRGKCAYCHKDISMELLAKPHIDHIIPLSRGGCNDLVNVQLCCETCNLSKGSRELDLPPSIPYYMNGHYFVSVGEWNWREFMD